jgi:UDP-3-O-acyl-N-acetylglucosamine deacetylase
LKQQRTIKSEGSLEGVGLFAGEPATVTFRPAPEDAGIVFVRTDVAGGVRIPAVAPNIAERSRRTSIKKGDISIETVEHCLAAIHALGIDNIIVEVDGSELPAPDCSSAEYLHVLKNAEVIEQPTPRKEFVIKKPVNITAGDATIYALPDTDGALNITYDLDYSGHAGIGRQIYSYRLAASCWRSRPGSSRLAASARTSAPRTSS